MRSPARSRAGRRCCRATIGCWAPESEVADILGEAERDHDSVAVGSYPFFREGRTGANFVIRSTDGDVVAACVAALTAAIEGAGYAVTDGGI